MGKKGFEYEIRGYRYAPESFRAFKGLPGQKMEQIPLSGEQRRKMGYLCMTQGGKAGEQSVECELDGNYRPVKVRKNYETADLSRPVVVWLYTA